MFTLTADRFDIVLEAGASGVTFARTAVRTAILALLCTEPMGPTGASRIGRRIRPRSGASPDFSSSSRGPPGSGFFTSAVDGHPFVSGPVAGCRLALLPTGQNCRNEL